MYAIGVYGWPGWDATFEQSPLMLFEAYPRVELDCDLVLDVTTVETAWRTLLSGETECSQSVPGSP